MHTKRNARMQKICEPLCWRVQPARERTQCERGAPRFCVWPRARGIRALFGIAKCTCTSTSPTRKQLCISGPPPALTQSRLPGYLDNSVAGSILSEMGAFEVLVKEFTAEASLSSRPLRQLTLGAARAAQPILDRDNAQCSPSSLAASVSSHLSAPGALDAYDFDLLSAAAGLVYAYALALPILSLMLMEAQILAVIPVPVRWALVGIGFGLSGYFLMRSVYPMLSTVRAPSLLSLPSSSLPACAPLLFFPSRSLLPSQPPVPAFPTLAYIPPLRFAPARTPFPRPLSP
ncbi:hypothetical protein FB451DRAFT_1567666 [Mycena latifolia]|nr:hypothetical protein FB451DRAFT_1567666 [Mycena latifolia]